MDDRDVLARRFEAARPRLRAVAYRMLGSSNEADDAVQEAWLRLNRSDSSDIDNLGGWLTTVVARVCLDMLRSRRSRREEPLEPRLSDSDAGKSGGIAAEADPESDPERQAVLADSVGPALLVILETLAPAERLALVLHDLFGVPFEEIAAILDRTPASARQLASRARRRVQGTGTPSDVRSDADRTRQHEVVAAFLAAARAGEFQTLVELLDPDVVARADRVAAQLGAQPELRGRTAVANRFSGQALGARLALVDGVTGLVWARGGRPRVVFSFTVVDGRITGIDLVSDPDRLDEIDLTIL